GLLSGRWLIIASVVLLLLSGSTAHASEADLAIPDLHAGHFKIFGTEVSAWNLLFYGALVICGTLGISLYLRSQIHKLPAHKSMLNVAEVIYQTCKTYLIQQGKFLLMLFVLIAAAISFYIVGFGHEDKHEMTYRTIQELQLEGVDKEVLAKLSELMPSREQIKMAAAGSANEEERKSRVKKINAGADTEDGRKADAASQMDRAAFLAALKTTLGNDWDKKPEGKQETLGAIVERTALPHIMPVGEQVLYVLLF